MDRSSTSTEVKLKDLKSLLPPSLTELNSRAVWSLSSCKAGYGIDHLLDNNVETYWQSDGAQPHLVNIMFRKKTAVSHVALYADLKADESYTPSRLTLRVGTHFNDLIDIKQIELKEPSGWHVFELVPPNDREDDVTSIGDFTVHQHPFNGRGTGTGYAHPKRIIKTFMVQIAVVLNYQNGRDTHIRQIKLFGPRIQNALPRQFAPFLGQSCVLR